VGFLTKPNGFTVAFFEIERCCADKLFAIEAFLSGVYQLVMLVAAFLKVFDTLPRFIA